MRFSVLVKDIVFIVNGIVLENSRYGISTDLCGHGAFAGYLLTGNRFARPCVLHEHEVFGTCLVEVVVGCAVGLIHFVSDRCAESACKNGLAGINRGVRFDRHRNTGGNLLDIIYKHVNGVIVGCHNGLIYITVEVAHDFSAHGA